MADLYRYTRAASMLVWLAAALVALALLLAPGALRHAFSGIPAAILGREEVLRLAAPDNDPEVQGLVVALHSAASITHVPAATSNAAVDALRTANAELALAPALVHRTARTALEQHALVLGVAGKRLVHLMAPADSAINGFGMLAGKRLGVGLKGTPEEAAALALLEVTPMDPKAELVAGHNLDLEQAFLDGEIDAALLMRPIGAPDVATLMATGYYRMLPLPAPASLIWKLPGAESVEIPPQTYPVSGNDAASALSLPTLAVPTLMLGSHHLSDASAGAVAVALADAAARVGVTPAVLRYSVAGLPMHPAAADAIAAVSPATGDAIDNTRTFTVGLLLLGLLLAAMWRQMQRRTEKSNYLAFQQLLRRALSLEATAVSGDSSERDAARKELLALEEDAARAWRAGALTASDLILLRLGAAGGMPERTLEELRAWMDAIAPEADAPPPPRPRAPVIQRPEPKAPAVTPRALEPAPAPARPATRETAFPDNVTVRVRPQVRDDDFEPAEPEPTPEPPRIPPKLIEDDFAPEVEEEPERASRFTAYTPIDAFEGNDEFGSGALLNTIRVRKSEDFDEPEEPPAPAPQPPAPAEPTPPPAAHAPQPAKAQKQGKRGNLPTARKAAKQPPQAKPAPKSTLPTAQPPAAPPAKDKPETGTLF